MVRSFRLIVACLPVAFLVGCTAIAFEGKVIEGRVGFVGSVDMSDERFEGPGIANAHVVVTASGAQSATATVAQGYTNEDGEFVFWISDEVALRNGVDVTTRVDGYFVTRGALVIPSNTKKALVILLRRSSDGEGAGMEPEGGSGGGGGER